MPWKNTEVDAFVVIFDVGRGNATFIRTPLNHGMIVDLSTSSEFSPGDFIEKNFLPYLNTFEKRSIAQAVLSHPHTDHISDCERLGAGKLYAHYVTCPNDKVAGEEFNWDRVNNIDGTKSLDKYRQLLVGRNPPLRSLEHMSKFTTVPPFEYGLYYLAPPLCDKLHPSDDNEYGNATSIVVYLRYGNNSVLLPGDITPEAMNAVLEELKGTQKRFTVFSQAAQAEHPDWILKTCDQPSLKSLLAKYGLSILVAPHHGLESCYSDELHRAMKDGKPQLVVISEKSKQGKNEGSIHSNYQCEQGASGLNVTVGGIVEKQRRSVTTREGHVLIRFNGSSVPRVYIEKVAEDLLKYMK